MEILTPPATNPQTYQPTCRWASWGHLLPGGRAAQVQGKIQAQMSSRDLGRFVGQRGLVDPSVPQSVSAVNSSHV